MRVLHVLDHSLPLHSGYAFRTRAILRQQAALGIETFHLTSTKHGEVEADVEEFDGLVFHRTLPSGSLLERMPVLHQYEVVRSLARRLLDVAKQVRPDVLHAHSPCLNGLAAIRVGRALGIPVVYEMRTIWEDAATARAACREGDLRYRASRALETRVLRRADAVTVICEGLRTEIVARGIPEDKVTVVANGVDLEEFDPIAARDEDLVTELGLDGRTVLAYIGSFSAYEGLPLLLDGFQRILADLPDSRLILVGGGHAEEELRARVKDLGLDGKVNLTGRVPHDQVARYYSLADVMVYPRESIRLTEIVTPLKPIEAMALRRLVVASDIGGHRELIRDGDTGELFRSGDPRSLSESVSGLLRGRAGWETRLDTARAFVERERTWAVSVRRCLPMYEGLLESAS